MNHVETIEEYLARGGKVTQVEYITPPEEVSILRHKPQFTTDLISLGEAEFYFGEHRGKPKTSKTHEKFNEALAAADLPQNIVDIISTVETTEDIDDE